MKKVRESFISRIPESSWQKFKDLILRKIFDKSWQKFKGFILGKVFGKSWQKFKCCILRKYLEKSWWDCRDQTVLCWEMLSKDDKMWFYEEILNRAAGINSKDLYMLRYIEQRWVKRDQKVLLIKIDESVFLKKYQRELASGNSNVTSHLITLPWLNC